MRVFAMIATVFVMLLTTGCETTKAYLNFRNDAAKIDTGLVEVRVFAPPAPTPDKATTRWVSSPLFLSKSARSDHLKYQFIEKGDSVSIRLLHAYVCEFYEQAQSRKELERTYRRASKKSTEGSEDDGTVVSCADRDYNRFGTRGEIAVLASAVEVDENGQGQNTGSGLDSMRLVYFDDDVRETGQALNQANHRIYGPISYQGRPLSLRLAIAELDQEEADETAGLLKALAGLGKQAYAPASPVLDALSKISDAYFSSKQDDLVFLYAMEFNSASKDAPPSENVVHLPLREGVYAFVRSQSREPNKINWEGIRLDPDTGRLLSGSDKGDWVKKTYLTIQVRRNEPSLSQDSFQTLSQFRASRPVNTESVGKSLEGLAIEVRAQAIYDAARSTAGNINANDNPTGRYEARRNMIEALCASKIDKDPASPRALTEDARLHLLRIASPHITDIAAALGASPELCGTWRDDLANASIFKVPPASSGDTAENTSPANS